MAYAALVCQGLLATVLLVAAASKVRGAQALRTFALSLTAMGLVRRRAALPLGAAVAGAEVTALVLVTLPATRRLGFAACVLLFAVLTAGVAVVLTRGKPVACRCFGASADPLSGRHVVRNAGLTGVALVGVAAPQADVAAAGALVALAGGVLAGLLVTILDDVVALFIPHLSPKETRWRT